MKIVAGKLYYEFKKDGWPFCPFCGDDELWCPDSVKFQKDNQRPPTVEECIKMGLACYHCGWSSERARYTIVGKDLVAGQMQYFKLYLVVHQVQMVLVE